MPCTSDKSFFWESRSALAQPDWDMSEREGAAGDNQSWLSAANWEKTAKKGPLTPWPHTLGPQTEGSEATEGSRHPVQARDGTLDTETERRQAGANMELGSAGASRDHSLTCQLLPPDSSFLLPCP